MRLKRLGEPSHSVTHLLMYCGSWKIPSAMDPRTQDAADITDSIHTPKDMHGTELQFSETTCNNIDFLELTQDGNTDYENTK